FGRSRGQRIRAARNGAYPCPAGASHTARTSWARGARRTGGGSMARDDERLQRSQEEPIVGGLPDVPGILVAMRLKPELGVHLRGLADEVLVHDYPGATISR